MEHDIATSAPQAPPPPPTPPPLPPPPPIEIEKDFIITLESLPNLWDKTHTNYINKYKRNDALQKLLKILIKIKPGATVEDVKKKINVLRSNYRRELKKIIVSRRSGSGMDDVYRPKSWTFEYLKFLEKFEQPVPLDRVPGNGDNHNEANSDSSYRDQEKPSTISSFVSAPPPPRRPSPLNSKKSVVKKQNELLERACDYLAKPVGSQVSDGLSIAFEWAETLQRLTPTQRLYAKKAINDILFEAELGNLDRYSVQINVTSNSSPASSLYSHTPSPNYMHTQTAAPAQSPQYTISHVSSPPESSPHSNHTHTEVTAPPTQSSQYTFSHVSSPPESSPHSNHTHTEVTAPPTQSFQYTFSHVSSPPESSPHSNHTHTEVTAPPTQSSQYTFSHVSSPPESSPHSNHTHTEVTAPPAQSSQYTISSASTSSLYSHTPSSNYMHTQVTAPLAQSEYILHIPSPSTMSQDSEYTAGSLFAQFKSGNDNGMDEFNII